MKQIMKEEMLRIVIYPMLNTISLDLDQPEASGVHKSPEITNAPEVQAVEEDYVPGQEHVDAE